MEIQQGQNKSLAHVINLKGIIEEVLRDYSGKDLSNEFIRFEIADRIHERYTKLVKDIAVKYLEYEASRRTTLATFEKLAKEGVPLKK